jgi:hypothetical protein
MHVTFESSTLRTSDIIDSFIHFHFHGSGLFAANFKVNSIDYSLNPLGVYL